MGMSPCEARRTSLWQYLAAWEGYVAANSSEDEKSLTTEETSDLWDWIEGM